MERRVVIAVALAIGVLFLTPKLFPPPLRVTPVAPSVTDSVRRPQTVLSPNQLERQTERVEPLRSRDSTRIHVETTVISTASAAFAFSSVGAALDRVQLNGFRVLSQDTGLVRLDSQSDPLVTYSIVLPNDTLSLEEIEFTAAHDTAARVIEYRSQVKGWVVLIRYSVNVDGYLAGVSGQVTDPTGQPPGDTVFLVVNLPQALESFEANVVEDRRGIAVSFKPVARGASQIGLGSLDPNETRIQAGPLRWVALKSKYFILGVVVADTSTSFAELQVRGLVARDRNAPVADISIVERLRGGKFAFDVYAGPQEWDVMRAVGRDFGAANSYGGWLQPVVQPFATIVMRVLLWMHRALSLHYGWVLLLFGVVVRVAMWPLNQTAMRSSMRMQELQPLLSEVQKRYKSDPQRMSAETMRLYKEHGMSPFSPLAGCFPILLSMPVLFALFFVFQSTIEFRGVPFSWLNDLSLKDSLYIAPLLMGGSMFLTSWLSMRSLPPNPQTRVMTYVLPVMMTVFLANMASGLNLYWAAQNVASLPQQWLIARERARAKARKASSAT